MYAMLCTRLDIYFSIRLSVASKIILDMLVGKQTRGSSIIFMERQIICSTTKEETCSCDYIDTEFGFNLHECKYTSSYVFLPNGATISCSSKMLFRTTLSIMSQNISHVRQLFKKLYGLEDSYDLGVVPNIIDVVVIHCHSVAELTYVKDPIYNEKSKHMGSLST